MSMLNLGAGNYILKDAVNHDLTKHRAEIDVVWDLNDLPWPWEGESFNKIVALSVLEHLRQNLLTSINEIWRLLVPGGAAIIKLPFWKAGVSWEDPTHLHMVGPGVMDQLDPRTIRGVKYWFYTPYKWRIDKYQKNKTGTYLNWTMTKMPENWRGKDVKN